MKTRSFKPQRVSPYVCEHANPNKRLLKSVLNFIRQITQRQRSGDNETCLKLCRQLLKLLKSWDNDCLLNKWNLIADIYSVMGNCHLEIGNYDKAIHFHNKDLSIGQEEEMEEAISRAIDNLGRTNIKRKEFQKAIDILETKLSFRKSSLESAWLHYELGRCYLELGNYERARKMGECSLTAAQELQEEQFWQMKALILVGQCELKLKRYLSAYDSFERGRELAIFVKKEEIQNTIENVLEDISRTLLQIGKEEHKQRTDQMEEISNENEVISVTELILQNAASEIHHIECSPCSIDYCDDSEEDFITDDSNSTDQTLLQLSSSSDED